MNSELLQTLFDNGIYGLVYVSVLVALFLLYKYVSKRIEQMPKHPSRHKKRMGDRRNGERRK